MAAVPFDVLHEFECRTIGDEETVPAPVAPNHLMIHLVTRAGGLPVGRVVAACSSSIGGGDHASGGRASERSQQVMQPIVRTYRYLPVLGLLGLVRVVLVVVSATANMHEVVP